jgi:DNA-binding ferritin-like protein (Dps family)
VAQTQEHLFHHCSQWKNQQNALWKAVEMATSWKEGRFMHVQVSELFSMEKCDQAMMDFLTATDVGKFPPMRVKERVEEAVSSGVFDSVVSLFGSVLFLCFLLIFLLALSLLLSFVKGDNG